MQNLKLFIIVVLCNSLLTVGFSQKIKLLEGSLSSLDNETLLNISYDWNEVTVGQFKKESDYIAQKKSEYNKKEAGRGDKWEDAWNGDKTKRFQPEFEKLFNKHSGKKGIYIGNEKEAKYTLLVKTTFIEPGFNVYVAKKPASIDLLVKIVETKNHGNVIATMVCKGILGRSYGLNDFDTGLRISESYALGGKNFGKYFAKMKGK